MCCSNISIICDLLSWHGVYLDKAGGGLSNINLHKRDVYIGINGETRIGHVCDLLWLIWRSQFASMHWNWYNQSHRWKIRNRIVVSRHAREEEILRYYTPYICSMICKFWLIIACRLTFLIFVVDGSNYSNVCRLFTQTLQNSTNNSIFQVIYLLSLLSPA